MPSQDQQLESTENCDRTRMGEPGACRAIKTGSPACAWHNQPTTCRAITDEVGLCSRDGGALMGPQRYRASAFQFSDDWAPSLLIERLQLARKAFFERPHASARRTAPTKFSNVSPRKTTALVI
jgi:hypothetical protein